MLKKSILILLIIPFISSCLESSSDPSATTVKIYKSDGSKQCEGPGIPLFEMELELTENGIEVISSNCGFITGLSVPAACGYATLNINIYKIDITNLDAAKALGFSPVSDLPGYRITDCSA